MSSNIQNDEEELRALFYEPKRRAATMFHNDHDDGDTALYQFISEIIPLIQADRKAREERLVREHDRQGFVRGVSAFSNYFMDASMAAQRVPIMPDIARELVDDYRPPVYMKVDAQLTKNKDTKVCDCIFNDGACPEHEDKDENNEEAKR